MVSNIQYNCVLKLATQLFQAGAMKTHLFGTVKGSVPPCLIKQLVQTADEANERAVYIYVSPIHPISSNPKIQFNEKKLPIL
jgi:hypothetical protein